MKKVQPRQAAVVLTAVVIVAAGIFAGRALKGGPEAGYAFAYDTPAYETTGGKPGLSKGGFSGFGETSGLEGATQLSGKVISVTPQQVVIEASNGARTTLRLVNPTGISRIETASREALRAGVAVLVVHAEGSDKADAVLVLENP